MVNKLFAWSQMPWRNVAPTKDFLLSRRHLDDASLSLDSSSLSSFLLFCSSFSMSLFRSCLSQRLNLIRWNSYSHLNWLRGWAGSSTSLVCALNSVKTAPGRQDKDTYFYLFLYNLAPKADFVDAKPIFKPAKISILVSGSAWLLGQLFLK